MEMHLTAVRRTDGDVQSYSGLVHDDKGGARGGAAEGEGGSWIIATKSESIRGN